MLGALCSNWEVSLSVSIDPTPMKSLPFATHQEAGTPWQIAWRNHGANESERYLAKLARRSFLTLWSYPNVYTDEGRRNGTGDGKELCDLLVVFGNHVLLFSDKHCEFMEHADPAIAWYRWYRRAIEKSAKQLAGAESWLRRFPQRLFVDRQCTQPLPLPLPSCDDLQVHLIAVAKGASAHAKAHWDKLAKGSSGSLILHTSVEGKAHMERPFTVGWPLPARKMVHVLDEETLDVVLGALDTITDLVGYLSEKERHFTRPDTEYLVLGEEELLAFYIRHGDPATGMGLLPNLPAGALAVLGEGEWRKLSSSRRYRKYRRAMRPSYLWDDLIEYQTSHMFSGSAYTIEGAQSVEQMELVLRMMAEETRHHRVHLGMALDRARKKGARNKRYITTVPSGTSKHRAYVVMSLPNDLWDSYDEYRASRQYQLATYLEGCKLRFPHLREIVGIAFEPYVTEAVSVDFLLIRFKGSELGEEWKADVEQRLQQENMRVLTA